MRGGHELHLLCQDRDPLEFDWVDAAGDWDGGALEVEARREPARATVYRPDIAGLLPLYVADRYEGVEAKPYPELTDAELDRYLERNVAAVREVAERVRPDVALANHLVMGPAILARALDGLGVPLRRQGPRQRAGVHGQAAPALPARTPARASRAASGGARRLAPHRREPVGGARRPRAARAGPASARPASTSPASRRESPARPGTASRRSRAELAAGAAGGDESGAADEQSGPGGRGRAHLVLLSPGRGGRGRARVRRAGRPARGLRRAS